MKHLYSTVVLLAAAACAITTVVGQSPSDPGDVLARYAACRLPDGPDVVETAPLSPGVHRRPIQTRNGEQMIDMEEGKRVMFAYPDEDFYANLKAERLPAATYAAEKQLLIQDFDHTLASGDGETRNDGMKPTLNGFEIYGLDRDKREGGVLGIYLFFDETRHDVVTIYFLNQEPPVRFKTMEEYARLRDAFLQSYTKCLASR
jgi:hypothetical protein